MLPYLAIRASIVSQRRESDGSGRIIVKSVKTEITRYKHTNASEKVKLQNLKTKQIPIHTLQRRSLPAQDS